MNKLYTLKSLLVLVACFAFAGTLAAQSYTLVPGNSVSSMIDANGFIEPKIEALNNTGGDITLEYELLSNTLNSAWSILLCDNVNCYPSAWQSATMDPIGGGVQEMIFKVTLDPQGTAGTGALVYRLWDRANPGVEDTISFDFEVTPATSLAEELIAQIKVFPQPATDLVYVELPSQMGRVELDIVDLAGAVVARHNVNGTNAELDVTNLAHGMYILRIKNDDMVLNKRISVQ